MTIPNIVNASEVAETAWEGGDRWASYDKRLTPTLATRLGHLGVTLTRVPAGKSACPFHTHQIEDEVFFVLSGRGVLRYGDALHRIKAGDCVSCPAGTGVAHQLANPYDEDLVYLAIGMNDPNEVCTYPDSGKIMVHSLDRVGRLGETEYMDGEPSLPRIFGMIPDEPAENDSSLGVVQEVPLRGNTENR